MTTPGTNPFGGATSGPLPGGGGSYLSPSKDLQPARHIVMLEKLQWKEGGDKAFKAKAGAAIADFTIFWTDAAENHKVGATYSVYHGFDKALGKGNCVVDLAAYRSVILGRPVQAAEVTDAMLAAAYNVPGFTLAEHDPEVFAILGATGYRGMCMVATCRNKPTQAGKPFTITNFFPLGDNDIAALKRDNPAIYAQLFPQAPSEQAAG